MNCTDVYLVRSKDSSHSNIFYIYVTIRDSSMFHIPFMLRHYCHVSLVSSYYLVSVSSISQPSYQLWLFNAIFYRYWSPMFHLSLLLTSHSNSHPSDKSIKICIHILDSPVSSVNYYYPCFRLSNWSSIFAILREFIITTFNCRNLITFIPVCLNSRQ